MLVVTLEPKETGELILMFVLFNPLIQILCQHVINIKLAIAFFSYMKLSKPGVYLTLTAHLHSQAKFSLKMLDFYLDS